MKEGVIPAAVDQRVVDRETGDWYDFRGKLLNDLGKDLPLIGGQANFLAQSESRGFHNGRTFVSGPARHWLMAIGIDGVYDRFKKGKPLGKRQDKALTAFCYYVFTDARFEPIGKMMGYTAGVVSIRLYDSILNAFNDSASDQVRARLPFNKDNFRKVGVKINMPSRSEEFALKMSDVKGGTLREVRQLIDAGITDSAVISDSLKIPVDKAGKAITLFRRRKVLPESKRKSMQDLVLGLKKAQTAKEARAQSVEDIGASMVKNNPDLFMAIGRVVALAGFSCSPREVGLFADVLRRAGIDPITIKHSTDRQSQHLLKQEVEDACQILKDDVSLKFYKPIIIRKQVAGPILFSLPNWTQVSEDYFGIAEILRRKNIPRSNIGSIPVPVIAFPNMGFMISKSNMNVFNAWLEELPAVV